MRVPTNLARGGLGFNMTPMIDVVFLLIIFFLLSSHLAQQEVQLRLDLPEAASGSPPGEPEARQVVINVLPRPRAGKQVMVAGRLVARHRLPRLIEHEHGRAREQQRPLEVRIRSDRRVPYQVVEPLLVACARSGVWKVTFAVVGNRSTR